MNGDAGASRRLIDRAASRRTFLRGAAAAGVGAAIATLWEPGRLAQVRAAHAAALSPTIGEALGRDAWIGDGGGSRRQQVDDRARMTHLLRRTGFSATPAEIDALLPLGLAGAVDQLLNYAQTPDPALDYANGVGLDLSKPADAIRWWLLRMIYTTRPLQEKLTLFWHGHFAVANYKVNNARLMHQHIDLLRAHSLGRFDDLLMGVSRDPAMLVWLDGGVNRRNAPNENLSLIHI